MLNKDFTVYSRSKKIKSPIDDETYQLIKNGQASSNTIQEYLSKINAFLEIDSSANHEDYYEAVRQQNNLHNYLIAAEDKEKQDNKVNPKAYFRRGLTISAEDLDRKVVAIIQNNTYSDSEREGALIFLSDDIGLNLKDLRQYYLAKKIELERKEDIEMTQQSFNQLIRLQEQKFNIAEVLPQTEAELISEWCKKLDLRDECALTTLLVSLSSCFDYRTKIVGIKDTNFTQHSALYGTICGESGTGKSILMKKFMYKPLSIFQAKFEEQFQREKEEARKEIEEYELLAKDMRVEAFPEGKPKEPERARRCFLTETTFETFAYLYKAHPGATLLYASEEINKLFKGLNQYKGGQGTDEEKLIELYDGSGICIGRVKEENNLYVPESGLSVFGGVQPDVLKEIWGDGEDKEGRSSRFLYVYQPINCPKIALEDIEKTICPLDERIEMLFGTVMNTPVTTYYLSKKAYRKFAIFFNYLSTLTKDCDRPFLRHVCSKAKAQCLRLALNLHAINSIWKPQFYGIPEEIPEDVMIMAVDLTMFYMDQVEYLLRSCCPEDTMTEELQLIYNFSKRKGSTTARDVKRYIRKLKKADANIIREHFLNLESMGKGKTEGKGSRLKYLVS